MYGSLLNKDSALLAVGNTIQFRFDVGNGIQTLEQTTAYPMNDDKWHTVHVERNRRQAMLTVDQQAAKTHEEPTDQGFRVLNLNSNFVVGMLLLLWFSHRFLILLRQINVALHTNC